MVNIKSGTHDRSHVQTRWTNRALHLSIFLIAFNLFIRGIAWTSLPIFDEQRYVSAARQFLLHGVNENWAHPPLAKILIAIGIWTLGDSALGWRWMSALFGALCVNAMYCLALILLKSRSSALKVALLCLINQMLFSEARIADLEIFMFLFMLCSVLFLLLPKSSKKKEIWAGVASGIFLGLAIACKWFAIVLFLFALSVQFKRSHWIKTLFQTLLYWIFVPAITYASVLLMMVGMAHPKYAGPIGEKTAQTVLPPQTNVVENLPQYSFADLIKIQWSMLSAQMKFENPTQAFQSSWYEWPLMLKPTWFEQQIRDRDGELWFKSAGFFANPFYLWLGFLSFCVCIWAWFKTGNAAAKSISILYLIFWCSWIFIPRHTTFFYYYFPAGMILALAIVFATKFLQIKKVFERILFVLLVLAFIYFYPMISGMEISSTSFSHRIWLNSWDPR